MSESDPKSMDELTERMNNNMLTSGFGIENIMQHTPCPFCGMGHWNCFKLLDLAMDSSVMEKENTCKSCGRSGKVILTEEGNTTYIELVQTGGEDQSKWLTPKYRRIDKEESEENKSMVLGYVTIHPGSSKN